MRSPHSVSAHLAKHLIGAVFLLCCTAAQADLTATFNAAADVPLITSSYTASGDATFTLNFAPEPGTNLTVVKNTGLPFIQSSFNNLANGAAVNLSFNGTTYPFVAWYYGGEGNNDLVLLWPYTGLAAWGDNDFGELGDSTTTQRNAPVAVNQTGALAGKTIVQVVRVGPGSLALTTEGRVYAWGNNGYGQLGDNTTTHHPAPVEVNTVSGTSALFGKTVVAIAAGSSHSLTLCSDGTVVAWGNNQYGQLGDNTTSNRLAPVTVNTTSGTSALFGKTVVAVSAGFEHSLALCSDGTLVAWGLNHIGQLGDNTQTQRNAPVTVNKVSGTSALFGKTVVAVAGGDSFSLALCSDGSVMAWGSNFYSQLGDGTTTDRMVPVAVNTSSALFGKIVVAIESGNLHSLALCSDGSLAAWGYNYFGQLGDNTTTQRNEPVAVNTASGTSALFGKTVVALAGGNHYSQALCTDGTLTAWGSNNYSGVLGDNSTTDRKVPVAVSKVGSSALKNRKVSSLAGAGTHSFHSLAIYGAPLREIAISGNNKEITNGDTISSTVDHTDFGSVLLTTASVVRTFTISSTGIEALNLTGTPKVVIGGPHADDFIVTTEPTSPVAKLAGTTTFQVTFDPSAPGARSATLSIVNDDSDENPYIFGIQGVGISTAFNYGAATDVPITLSSFTASGDANFTLNFAPTPGTNLTVVKTTGPAFIQGTFNNLANGATVNLSYNGTTYPFIAWYYGGDGNNDLVLLWPYTGLAAWGNNFGLLGDNTTTQRNTPVAVDQTNALAGKTIVQVVRGAGHTLALTSEGRVYSWGTNGNGQLGDNTTTQRLAPVAVNIENGTSALFGKTVVAIAAGLYHSLAVCSDGTLAAWGYNRNSQLGDATVTDRNTPTAVYSGNSFSALFGKTVVAVAGGEAHSLALCSDGTLAAWGHNSSGQLGDNTTTERNIPVAVNRFIGSALSSGKIVVAISTGSFHNLVLCSDGTLAAWGRGGAGQLGDTTTVQRSVPVTVNRTSGTSAIFGRTVVTVATGRSHSMALCSDGTLTTWGDNSIGQLGDNTIINRTAPVMVNTVSGISALFGKTVVAHAAGMFNSLALCSDGTLAAWGYNYYGQLGDGTTTKRLAPIAVNTTIGASALAGRKASSLAGSGSLSFHSLAIYGAPLMGIAISGNSVEIADGASTPGTADHTDFGMANLIGDSVAHTFTISNSGFTELNLTGTPKVSISGAHAADFTVTTQPISPMAALTGTTTFQVTFVPSALGLRCATLSIANDSDVNSYTFNIQGSGSEQEIAVELPDSIGILDGGSVDFGSIGIVTGVGMKTFTIKNEGAKALTGLNITKSGLDQALFTVTALPATTIAVNSSMTFTVQVSTPTKGLKSPLLHIASDDSDESPFDITFTTTGVTAAPPAVTTVAATGITFSGATLNGKVNANNSERTVFFDYGTTTSYGSSVAATPGTVTGNTLTNVAATITGLMPHTKYNFRVRAAGPLGAANGANLTFTTLNRAPIATGEPVLALPLAKVTIPVLSNDADPDGDALSITSFTQPGASVGTVAKVGTDLVFTPSATFAGGSFTYTAADALGLKSNAATVTLQLADCTLGPDVTIPADSPAYDLTVSATAPWTVIESLSWLSFVPPAPGATSVRFIPAPNPSKDSRAGTVKIGGRTHMLTQRGVLVAPVLTTPAPIPNAAISASYDLIIPTLNGPVTYTTTGMPKGLVFSNVTGHITGYPTEAKTSTVTVKAKNVWGDSNTISFDITVLAFPPALAGGYSATIADSETLTDKFGGLMTMTVTNTGGVTGMLKLGTGSHPFTGRLNTAVNPLTPDPDHAILKTSIKRAGKPAVDLTVNMSSISTDLIEGDVILPGAAPVSATLTGSKHVWQTSTRPADQFKGYFTAALEPTDTSASIPQGDGFLTFSVSAAGAVSWSGQLADGTVIATQSATLWANGEFPLFALLYSNKGSLNQRLSIASGTKIVSGSPRWHKKPQTVRVYSGGFDPTTLMAVGTEYLPPGAGQTLLNIAAPGSANIDFLDGGIGGVSQFTDLDQVFAVSATHAATFAGVNPALVKLTKIDIIKGTFTGTMTVKDNNPFNAALPQISRLVNFNGVLLPTAGMGTGYFLLPSIAGPPANVTTSPMTSGQVRVVP